MVPMPGARVRAGYSLALPIAPGPTGLAEAERWVRGAFDTLEEETAWRGAAKTTD
jgi:hypothetical protein